MKPLHFVSGPNISFNVRIQRFMQHSVDCGENPAFFHQECRLRPDSQQVWIPDFEDVDEVTYKRCRRLNYLLPAKSDPIGLKKVFRDYGCEVVHAHNLFAALYSADLGLPTVFDDWEYFLGYFRYMPLVFMHWSNKECLRQLVRLQSFLGFPKNLINRFRGKVLVKKLLREVPVFVSNRYVKECYERLGGKAFFVPNVPLRFERDFVASKKAEKASVTTTCYVGSFENDNARNPIRDASEVPSLWRKHDLGRLFVFEAKNWCSHLDLLCKLKSCHFNLLFWRPKLFHRFYNQNKAFLAAVVGVPTIISASLVDTVNLLGEYALPVMQPEDIPLVIKSYEPRDLAVKREHLFEFYSDNVASGYLEAFA